MEHFKPEQWADFVRGLVEERDKSIMDSHLRECKECLSELTLWQRVSETAKRQLSSDPCDAAVRNAKAMFADYKIRVARQAEPTIARLLFDSFTAPAMAGVRSATSGPRQLLFGLGDHRIDLRIEPQTGTDK